jgi:hypothetical protein
MLSFTYLHFPQPDPVEARLEHLELPGALQRLFCSATTRMDPRN